MKLFVLRHNFLLDSERLRTRSSLWCPNSDERISLFSRIEQIFVQLMKVDPTRSTLYADLLERHKV